MAELLEYNKINNQSADLFNNKQISYKIICSIKLVDIKRLKTYIKINLANKFIQSFISLVNTLILFVQKKDSYFYLYINY